MLPETNKQEDQNERELKFANQREENARTPLREDEVSEEESAAIASRVGAKPGKEKDLGEVPPEKQHTRIP